MVHSLSAFALCVLLFSAAAFVCVFLLPEGSLGDTAKQALTVVLLASSLTPLLPAVKTALPDYAFPSAPAAADAGDLFSDALAHTLGEVAAPVIGKYTDLPYDLRVTANTAPDGGIDITVVEIRFDGAFDGEAALSRELIDLLGTRVLVIAPAREEGDG